MARFIHHYTRFRAHRDSCRLEKVRRVMACHHPTSRTPCHETTSTVVGLQVQEPETRERVMRCLSVWQQECRRKRSGEETDISG